MVTTAATRGPEVEVEEAAQVFKAGKLEEQGRQGLKAGKVEEATQFLKAGKVETDQDVKAGKVEKAAQFLKAGQIEIDQDLEEGEVEDQLDNTAKKLSIRQSSSLYQ